MGARRSTALFVVAVMSAGTLLGQAAGAAGAATSATDAAAGSRAAAALNLSAPPQIRYDVIPHAGSHRPALATSTLPTWTHTVDSPAGNSFTFTMVGGDPYTTGTTTTTVSVPIIGVHLVFAGGGETDATAVGSDCNMTSSPVQSALSSPIFSSSVGGTQYVDAFQRANFGDATSASGSSPNYHLLLSGSQGPALTLNVPLADGSVAVVGCGANPNAVEGLVDQNWLDAAIISAMPTIAGISPGVFPIFLLYDTLMTFAGGVGAAAGYHTVVPANMQTYAVADYQQIAFPQSPSDVEPLTHETVEWANDPFVDNIVPTWGHIGQVSGCNSVLEAADPLSNLVGHPVTIGSTTYHVPDAAFVPWFFRESPSPSGGGAYSLFGSLAQPSDPSACPAQPVSVKVSPGDGQLTVSWSEPSKTATISGFEVLLFRHQEGVDVTTWLATSTSPLPAAFAASAAANATSATIKGPANGTAYDAVVLALSANGDGGSCNALVLALGEGSNADDCSTPSFVVSATPAASATTTTTSTTTASSQGAPSSSPAQATLSSGPTSTAATSSGGSGSQLALTGATYTLLLLALGALLTVIGAFGRGRSRARRLPR